MRHLHPERNQGDECEMLASSNREWRRDIASQLNFDSNMKDFGGHFKEHIKLATLSPRCYQLVQTICAKYSQRLLKEQNNTKGNRTIFSELPGMNDESLIYKLLSEFASCKISKEEFNRRAKIYKQDTSSQPKAAKPKQNISDALREAQGRVERLELENRVLREELAQLRKEMKESAYLKETETGTSNRREPIAAAATDLQEMEMSTRSDMNEESSDLDVFDFHDDPPFTVTDINESANLDSQDNRVSDTEPQLPKATSATDSKEALFHETMKRLETQNKEKDELSKNVQEKTSLPQEGVIVEARDTDMKWYRAKVLETGEEKVMVHFIGYSHGYDRWVEPCEVRDYELKAGDKVKAKWHGKFYRAIVIKKMKTGYKVRYQSDGVESTVKTTDIEIC